MSLAGGRFQFLIGEEFVAGAEVDGLSGDLLDAAAAADRLVVELDGRVDLGVLAEPLGVERVGEGGAGAVDERFGRGRSCRHGCQSQAKYQMFLCIILKMDFPPQLVFSLLANVG